MAVSELYKFVTWASRIYKYTQTYSIYNRTLPRLLFEAENIDGEDILANLTDYRAWLDTFIQLCGTLTFPGNLAFYSNIDELFSVAYCDENTERAQITIFSPHVFYQYDETTIEGGMLFPIIPGYKLRVSKADYANTEQHSNAWDSDGLGLPFTADGKITFAKIREIGSALLDSLLKSDDVCKICTDIAKAYSPDKLLTFTYLEEHAALPIVHSDKMNLMIENARLLGTPQVDTNTGNNLGSHGNNVYAPCVKQATGIDKGNLQFRIFGSARSCAHHDYRLQWYFEDDYIFNVHDDMDVTPDDMVDLCRFVPTLRGQQYGSSTDAMAVVVDSCGTEILTEASIFKVMADGSISKTSIGNGVIMITPDMDRTVKSLSDLSSIYAFNVFPRVTLFQTANDGSGKLTELVNFDKYAVIPQADLKQIHDAYLLGQFQVPDFNYTAK